jgi:putative DNA methylase
MFSPRQLLGLGVLMEELHAIQLNILAEEGEEKGEAVVHLLAFVVDKLANWNCILSSWNIQAQTVHPL